jgi:hypothetical protein
MTFTSLFFYIEEMIRDIQVAYAMHSEQKLIDLMLFNYAVSTADVIYHQMIWWYDHE